MKITIDSILSTAININNQKNIYEKSVKNAKEEGKFDIVEIRSKLISRLGIIKDELKTLQSSLTKNQIIQEGLNQLDDDNKNSKGKMDFILERTTFEDVPVLRNFLGDNIDSDKIKSGREMIQSSLEKDLNGLKVIQVEIENIIASNLADDNIADMISNLEKSLSSIDLYTIAKISDLKPESVMGLI